MARDVSASLPSIPVIGRRSFLRTVGVGCLAAGAAASVTSCSAVPAPAPAPAVAFNPATTEWLADLARAVAATEVENITEGGLRATWSKWGPGVRNLVDSWAAQFPAHQPTGWVHPVPPVAMVALSKGKTPDPMSDGLLACVQDGEDAVFLSAPAWQTLAMFVHEITPAARAAMIWRRRGRCARRT